MKTQKGNVVVITLIIVVVAITSGVIGWMFAKKLQAPAVQIATPIIQPITQSTSQEKVGEWKVYTNPRVGYQFEYPSFQLTLELTETIKYPDANTINQDLVQFAVNTKDVRAQQPIAFGVRTYVGIKNNSIEDWIQKSDLSGNSNLSNYTKRLIDGQTAYTSRGISVTHVLYNGNVYVISAHAGIEPTFDTDPTYSHILSSFRFKK